MKLDDDSFERKCRQAWDKYPNEMGCLTSLRELLDDDLRGGKRHLLEEKHLKQRTDGTYDLAYDFVQSPVAMRLRIVDRGPDQGVTNLAIFDPRTPFVELRDEPNQAEAKPKETVQARFDCQGERPQKQFSAYQPFGWWMGDNNAPSDPPPRSPFSQDRAHPEGAVVLPRDRGHYEYERECRRIRRELATCSAGRVSLAPPRSKAPCS